MSWLYPDRIGSHIGLDDGQLLERYDSMGRQEQSTAGSLLHWQLYPVCIDVLENMGDELKDIKVTSLE